MTVEGFRADLHCHSTCSDGSCTPEKLVDLALELGIQGLSVTDHDTVEAYKTLLPYAKEKNIEIISGVEFSTTHKGISVHVLAYSFSVEHPLIIEMCKQHRIRREERNQAIVQKLREHGMPLDEGDLHYGKEQSMGRPHIAQAMLNKGYVESISDAFKRFLGDERPCYVRGKPSTTEATLEAIKAANAFAVIAHPHLIQNNGLLRDLLDMPFDGIECYYGKFLAEQNDRFLQIAHQKNWLATGGSDFHGDIKPVNSMASSWVGKDTFSILRERFKSNQ